MPSNPRPERRIKASPIGIASVALVVAGLFLGATVNMAWLILLAVGSFGPGLLREAGLLKDRDEFQHQITIRSGYRAYLAGGIFLTAVVIARTWGLRNLDDTAFPAGPVLALMLVTYFISYLTGYWGAQKAAFRILIAFGSFWMVFSILSGLAEGVVSILMQCLVPLPFFLLAFLSRRWPRVVGLFLVLFGIVAFFSFDLYKALGERPGQLFVVVLLFLPLVYSGIALWIGARRAPDAGMGVDH